MTERGRLRVLKLDTEESAENAAFATQVKRGRSPMKNEGLVIHARVIEVELN